MQYSTVYYTDLWGLKNDLISERTKLYVYIRENFASHSRWTYIISPKVWHMREEGAVGRRENQRFWSSGITAP